MPKKAKTCKKGKKPKRMYRDKIAAMFALANMQAKDSSTRGKLEKRVYFHYACKSWHTTSISQEEWEARVQEIKALKDSVNK